MQLGRTQEQVLAARGRGIAFRLHRTVAYAGRNPVGFAGGVVVVVFVIVALLSPWITPYDPVTTRVKPLSPPSREFWLGTDILGRDVLSRVIAGSRISLFVGLLTVLISQGAGMVLGIVSGYLGGKVDLVVQRFIDVVLSFPTLVFAMVIVSVLTPSFFNVVLAIAIVQTPRATRMIRSQAMGVRETDYILAAQAMGCSLLRVLTRHVAPQVLPVLVILATVELPHVIIVEASLSFLGVGVPPPAPSWGRMLSMEGRPYFEIAPWIALAPGMALSITVLGFNLFGDSLRDLLDPRMRGGGRARA